MSASSTGSADTQSASRPRSSASNRGSVFGAPTASSKNGTTIGPFAPAKALWMWPRLGVPTRSNFTSKHTVPAATSILTTAFPLASGSAAGTSWEPSRRAASLTLSPPPVFGDGAHDEKARCESEPKEPTPFLISIPPFRVGAGPGPMGYAEICAADFVVQRQSGMPPSGRSMPSARSSSRPVPSGRTTYRARPETRR